jgi:hypothetical protein
MKIVTLDVNHPLWLATLEKLPHDVYHLPDYVALDARRTKTLGEAFLLQDDAKIFFAPYLLRSCADIAESSGAKIYDIISPYGYPGILMSDAAAKHREFPDFALQQFHQALQVKGVCSAFLRLHPILGENFAKVFQSEITPPYKDGAFLLNSLNGGPWCGLTVNPCNGFSRCSNRWSNFLRENGKTISIDLTLDENKMWAKTRKGHQSTINKCIRLGFSARIVSFAQYLDKFICIYEETMNRVKAIDSYYFSRDYFEGLLKLGDKVHLGVVELKEEIVCACLFFESCGIVQAHLGGTKSEFLKQSPFNLLLHYMRLWAKQRGNQYLHIGGGVGGKQDNLYTFKSGFSQQRHDFFTLRLIVDLERYNDLLQFRANAINKSVEELQQSPFFPAYRAS